MELKELQSIFAREASGLGDYQLISKTDLANGYCDADDAAKAARANGDEDEANHQEGIRSQYYAALMLRYWYKIFGWISDSASLNLEPTDFVDWLNDALAYGLKARAWKDPSKPVYNDPNGPDKVFNQCCASERLIQYQYYNKQKRKGCTRNYSLDSMLDENGDCAAVYAGAIDNSNDISGAQSLIHLLLRKGEGVEALIVDGIAYYDTYKDVKVTNVCHEIDDETGEEVEAEYEGTTTRFDVRKLVKHLNSLDERFVESLCNSYVHDDELAQSTYNKLKKMNNTKLYKYIEKTLIELRQNPEFMECLTN